MSTAPPDEQCKALTEDGERCSRLAREDGFCFQHGPDDEVIDEAEEADDSDRESDPGGRNDATTGEESESTDRESTNGSSTRNQEDGGQPDETRNEGDHESTMTASESEIEAENIEQVRENVQRVAEDVVGRPLDGIPSIDDTEDGWLVAVEVVEREGVPDTQDILGRYELELDDEGSVTGYQRTHRYRRDDMDHDV